MSKQYKNVYTILEKVKKGEIKSYYKNTEGLFGKINFYKKPDIVKPHLHYIDEDRLESIVDFHLKSKTEVDKEFLKFAKTGVYKKLKDDTKPDSHKFFNQFQENYKKFPRHIAKDIFKMFYNKMEKLEFEERSEKNASKFKLLEKANNPVGKIMSEYSSLKSSIFTRNILGYFIARLTALDFIDADSSKKIKQSLESGSDFNNEQAENAFNDMLNSPEGKKMMDEAINEAMDVCKKIDESIPLDVQEQMFENSNKSNNGSFSAGKISPDYLKQVAAHLESVNLSMSGLKDKIKKLLDKSVSYFSAKKETKYEDLFNSDDVAGIEDFVLLHPQLRKMFTEDVMIKETKSVGKIDVYIDISGSMDSGCGSKNSKGQSISKLEFSKALTSKLKKMDMLNEVYVFNTSVKKIPNDIISISMIGSSGGTNINAVIRSIENNEVNALVITDAEDTCGIYSDKAFFIGVKGSRFNSFTQDVIKEYSNKNQVVVFDGVTISKVDEFGQIIV